MFKGEKVQVKIDIDKAARLVNAMEELCKTYIAFLPTSKELEEDLENIKYLREKMCESEELFCSVIVSTHEELSSFCAKYAMLASETDNILKEINKVVEAQKKKAN